MTKPKSWYGPMGSLLVEHEIPAVTIKLQQDAGWYDKPFMLAENFTIEGARRVSEALGFNF